MKQLYLLIFLAHFLSASNPNKGTIVILKGLASAGKSSICRALTKNDSSWKTIDEDEVYIKMFNNSIKKAFPEQFKAIKVAINTCNHFHAIERKEIIFKDNVSVSQQEAAIQAIEQITTSMHSDPNWDLIYNQLFKDIKDVVLKKIHKYIAHGKNIIVDSWILDPLDVQYLKTSTPIVFCMAYAPLLIIIERVIKRNNEACQSKNLMNKRLIRSSVESFKNLYTLSNQPNEGHIVDTMDYHYFLEFIEKVRTYLKSVPNSVGFQPFQKEISEEKLNSYCDDVKRLFQDDKVYITIPAHYDFVINTTDNTPEYYAQVIKEKITK